MKSPLIIATMTVCLSACIPTTPPSIGTAFCKNSQKNDDAGMKALLSPSLADFIHAAEVENDKIVNAAPDEKPPLGDGIPWQAYPDYAPICAVGNIIAISDDITHIDIHHRFTDTPDANWTDRLVLVRSSNGWALDDVLYGHDYKNGLRESITAGFSYYR